MNALNPFVLTDDRESHHFVHRREGKCSVPAMFAAALTDREEPSRLAIGALRQISHELMALGEYLELRRHSEAPIDESFIAPVINGIAERARVAAEVQSRLDAAQEASAEP